MKVLSTLLLLLLSGSLLAQEVQWASKVIDYSSQLGKNLYSAEQVLGPPDVSPFDGDNPNAWTPKRDSKTEFIIVGFDKPMKIQQIAIHESHNPGAVKSIYLYDKNENEYLATELAPFKITSPSRMLNIFIPMTEYEVHSVMIVLDEKAIEGVNSIDAIGISDSDIPVNIETNHHSHINPNLTVEPLSGHVNSKYAEMGPVISPDGKTLFFGRANHPYNIGGIVDHEDIWYSVWSDSISDWTQAKNIGRPLNTEELNYVNSASDHTGNLVLVLANIYGKGRRMYSGVSVTKQTKTGWSDPEPLEIENFYSLSITGEYNLARDLTTLLFAIDRPDSYGLTDLYVSHKKEDGKWSEPVNLGPSINTSHEELSPLLMEDMETMFFASGGYVGYGGLDLYVTKRLDDTWQHWSEPENLGPVVNSNEDELHLSMHENSHYGYFTRLIEGENTDIFRFNEDELFLDPIKHLPVEISLVSAEDKSVVSGRLKIEKLLDSGNHITLDELTIRVSHSLTLEVGSHYKITGSTSGYETNSVLVDLIDNNTVEKNIVVPLTKSTPQ